MYTVQLHCRLVWPAGLGSLFVYCRAGQDPLPRASLAQILQWHSATYSLEVMRVTLHQQSNDQAEKSEDSSKDLDGENLDESRTRQSL
jgi:hypothetical protein